MSTIIPNPGERNDEVKQPNAGDDQKGMSKEDIAKNVELHKQAAAHYSEAAKHHLEAAKNHEAGEHEKAAHNTVLAHGHSAIAGGFLNDEAKHHAQTLKQIKYQ